MKRELIKSLFYDDFDVMQMLQKQETDALIEKIAAIQLIKGDTGDKGEKGDSITGPIGIRGEKGEIGKSIVGPRGLRGEKGDSIIGPQGIAGRKGRDGIDATFDLAEVIAAVIEEIKKKKSIDISNIRNADSFIFNKTRYKTHELMHGGAAPTTTQTIAQYDISSQFNGILTTFTLPAYTSILSFTLTGWPPNGNLRPTVDFTTPTNTTVQLDAALGAPVAGTTGIIIYIV